MSKQVQAIVDAVRNLDQSQRRELTSALAEIDGPSVTVSDARKHLVDSIRGKYRHVPTSSESFISRKAAEIIRESGS